MMWTKRTAKKALIFSVSLRAGCSTMDSRHSLT